MTHRLRLDLLPGFVLKPTSHLKTTARVLYNLHHDRQISDARQEHEDWIAKMESISPGFERRMRKDDGMTVYCAAPPPGHKYWGLTIFRCTYGDDEAWSQLMKYLNDDARDSTERCGAPELMESLNLKVHDEEPSVLVGASKALIRYKFRQWRSSPDTEREELDGRQEGVPILMQGSLDFPPHGTTPRYQYCVYIDESSLYSIIDRETKKLRPWASTEGHVNLIDGEWQLHHSVKWAEAMDEEMLELDPLNEYEEAIEGCRLHDVGWMKAGISVLGLEAHSYLNPDRWEGNYVRPPYMLETF